MPEGLADRLQASNWSERDEAITELERYVVSSPPQNLSPQLQKVVTYPLTQTFLHNFIIREWLNPSPIAKRGCRNGGILKKIALIPCSSRLI